MPKLKTYHVALRSNCFTVVEVEAKSPEDAEELVMQGEYTTVIDVEHDDTEVADVSEYKK